MKLFNLAKFRPARQDQPTTLPPPRAVLPPAVPVAQPPAPASPPRRAFVLLKSGRRLDLLDPHLDAWTDEDLATGLSRTYRWGGYSKWDLPLSVAQHSLTVLALREAEGPLTAREALRELLHDSTEFMLGWDCIAPLKAQLGPDFAQLDQRLQEAVDHRLPAWTEDACARHKRADRLAAASEAFHVVAWSREEMREALEITLDPLDEDPLRPPDVYAPWEPWPPALAQWLFMRRLDILLACADVDDALAALAPAFSRCPAGCSGASRSRRPEAASRTSTLVSRRLMAPADSRASDGELDEDGAFRTRGLFHALHHGR